MRQGIVPPDDDATTLVLVCGVLAGLTGGLLAMGPTAVAALIGGKGLGFPNKLVASALMGSDAFARENAVAATMLGALLTLTAAAGAGALFAFLRRRETRIRLLVAEGLGFSLVAFGAMRIALPYVDPALVGRGSTVASILAFLLFGACLALELPLRVGSFDVGDPARVRESLDQA